MKTNENQKPTREYKVYIHRLKTWVEVTEEQYYAYYRDIWATRKRAQAHGQCMCPKSKTWMCDGDWFPLLWERNHSNSRWIPRPLVRSRSSRWEFSFLLSSYQN